MTWRQGVKQKLRSRFAAVRVRPAVPGGALGEGAALAVAGALQLRLGVFECCGGCDHFVYCCVFVHTYSLFDADPYCQKIFTLPKPGHPGAG